MIAAFKGFGGIGVKMWQNCCYPETRIRNDRFEI